MCNVVGRTMRRAVLLYARAVSPPTHGCDSTTDLLAASAQNRLWSNDTISTILFYDTAVRPCGKKFGLVIRGCQMPIIAY